jgi:hypothetical protein
MEVGFKDAAGNRGWVKPLQ